jgi:hypothetical protein
MERMATDGSKKIRRLLCSLIADFCNKIGTCETSRRRPGKSAYGIKAAYRHTPRNGSVVSSLHCMNDPQPEGHMASYNFATISSGLYRFLVITVLLDVKDIPQVGPLQWGWITSDRLTASPA